MNELNDFKKELKELLEKHNASLRVIKIYDNVEFVVWLGLDCYTLNFDNSLDFDNLQGV